MKGGKADNLTLPKIAKKHGVPIEDLMVQFKLGIKTEMEHTDNKKQAKEIAMDHLAENPKYYTLLKKAKLEENIIKKLKEELNYPIEDKGKWYGDEDYEKRGGKLVYMTPDEFLTKTKELNIDDEARENIEDIKEHIKSGKKLGPLALYSSDKTNVRNSDGRHRAIAAKELGIKEVPVIDFVSDGLKEDAIPSKLDKDVNIEYHKKLNDKFWLNNHLKNSIRKKLLSLAKYYFKTLDLDSKVKIKDIIFTGSLANYNYTNLSDIDLHIVIEYKNVSDDVDFVKDYFSQKRAAWEVSNDVKINDYPVEIYVQDVNEDTTGKGAIYSLVSNKWIKKPKYKLPEVDKHLITKKVNKYLDILNKISMMKDSQKKLDNYNKIFDKIKKSRGESTKKEGEFSVDNLVFKVLRNKNVFDIVKNNKKDIVNKLFSMKTN
jgi:predicted nucleotidyltransferase